MRVGAKTTTTRRWTMNKERGDKADKQNLRTNTAEGGKKAKAMKERVRGASSKSRGHMMAS
jgi:hypothetical protein